MYRQLIMLIHFLCMFSLMLDMTECCRFGSGANCAFPCNCNSTGCDQETGDCSGYGGCKQGLPAGHGWGGPGCLVGNVAYNKSSSQSSDYRPSQSASRGNDGYICSRTRESHTNLNKPAWFSIDFVRRHHIHNVTFYPRVGNIARTVGFRLQILDSNITQDCATITDTNVDRVMTFTCNMVGDTVRLYRDDIHQYLQICELVVIGYPHIANKFECLEWVDDILGCKICQAGKKLPDCVEDCPNGYYGVNCQYQCSNNCGTGPSPICDPVSGLCRYGCIGWYVGDKCDTEIDITTNTTSSSMTITWKPAIPPPSGKEDYYHYTIRYRIAGGSVMDTQEILLLDDTASERSYTIANLQHNTVYEFMVRIVRTVGDMSDYYDSSLLTMKTKCKAPVLPITIMMTGVGSTEFKVSWEIGISDLDSGCDSMTMQLQYKYAHSENWMSIEINENSLNELFIPSNGHNQCLARIIGVNNEQITSTYTATASIILPSQAESPSEEERGATMMYVGIALVIIAVVIAVISVIGAVLFVKRIRAKLSNDDRASKEVPLRNISPGNQQLRTGTDNNHNTGNQNTQQNPTISPEERNTEYYNTGGLNSGSNDYEDVGASRVNDGKTYEGIDPENIKPLTTDAVYQTLK